MDQPENFYALILILKCLNLLFDNNKWSWSNDIREMNNVSFTSIKLVRLLNTTKVSFGKLLKKLSKSKMWKQQSVSFSSSIQIFYIEKFRTYLKVTQNWQISKGSSCDSRDPTLGSLEISPQHRYIAQTSISSFSSFVPLLLCIL